MKAVVITRPVAQANGRAKRLRFKGHATAPRELTLANGMRLRVPEGAQFKARK